MAEIGLPKGSGKRLKVREKSVKSQGILKWILSGNPARPNSSYMDVGFICCITDKHLFICAVSAGSVSLKIMRLKSYIFF